MSGATAADFTFPLKSQALQHWQTRIFGEVCVCEGKLAQVVCVVLLDCHSSRVRTVDAQAYTSILVAIRDLIVHASMIPSGMERGKTC